MPRHPLIEILVGVLGAIEGLDFVRLRNALAVCVQLRLRDLNRRIHGGDLLFDLRRVALRDTGLRGPVLAASIIPGGGGGDVRPLIERGRQAVVDARDGFDAFAEVHAAIGQAECIRRQIAGDRQPVSRRSNDQRYLGCRQQG